MCQHDHFLLDFGGSFGEILWQLYKMTIPGIWEDRQIDGMGL